MQTLYPAYSYGLLNIVGLEMCPQSKPRHQVGSWLLLLYPEVPAGKGAYWASTRNPGTQYAKCIRGQVRYEAPDDAPVRALQEVTKPTQ